MDTPNQISVLVAEDDARTAALINSYLANEGFEGIIAADGKTAIQLFEERRPQLAILDLMLPKVNGMDVCSAIRKLSTIPILFLTARDDEIDKVLALGLGADDYIVKPFSPRELMARVKAQLRRANMAQQKTIVDGENVISQDGLVLEVSMRRFTLNGQLLSLTPLEYSLLKTFISAPGRVFLRTELLDKLYPDGEIVVDRVIDVHVGKLRQKIGDDPNQPTFIHTVRGIGYRFADRER